MPGNRPLLLVRTPRKHITNTPCELLDVLGIECLTPFGGALSSQSSGLSISEALLFRPCEGAFLDQHTLSLVPFPRTAKPDDHGPERRIPAGSPGECSIATRQEREMIEIGTREAPCANDR